MNFASSTPWYRRFVFGDRWPNKTSWYLLQAQVRGRNVLVERHTRSCSCSYCRGEHGHGLLWIPADRRRGWRVINLLHRVYIRWVPRVKRYEERGSKGANYQVPGGRGEG